MILFLANLDSTTVITPSMFTDSSWVRRVRDLRSVDLQATAIQDRLRDVDPSAAAPVLEELAAALSPSRLSLVLRRLPSSTLKPLLSGLPTAALQRLKEMLSGKIDGFESTSLALAESLVDLRTEEDEDCIPESVIERANSAEVFLDEIQRMMYACGDSGLGSRFAAVIVKDSVGEWLRSRLALLGDRCKGKSKQVSLAELASTFPSQFRIFRRWLVASKEGKTSQVGENGVHTEDSDNEDEDVEKWQELHSVEEEQEERISFAELHRAELGFSSEFDIEIPELGLRLGGRRRLVVSNERTVEMSSVEYKEFSSCRTASFISRKLKDAFYRWIKISTSAHEKKEVLAFVAYLAWDRIATIIEVASSLRQLLLQHKNQNMNLWRKVPFRMVEIVESIRILDQSTLQFSGKKRKADLAENKNNNE